MSAIGACLRVILPGTLSLDEDTPQWSRTELGLMVALSGTLPRLAHRHGWFLEYFLLLCPSVHLYLLSHVPKEWVE